LRKQKIKFSDSPVIFRPANGYVAFLEAMEGGVRYALMKLNKHEERFKLKRGVEEEAIVSEIAEHVINCLTESYEMIFPGDKHE